MARKKTKANKIRTQRREQRILEKQKMAASEFEASIKTIEYRKQETGIKRRLTNSERQKEFERKQEEDGLRKISFWLSEEMIDLIKREQKEHLKKYRIKLSQSKILTNMLRKYSAVST